MKIITLPDCGDKLTFITEINTEIYIKIEKTAKMFGLLVSMASIGREISPDSMPSDTDLFEDLCLEIIGPDGTQNKPSQSYLKNLSIEDYKTVDHECKLLNNLNPAKKKHSDQETDTGVSEQESNDQIQQPRTGGDGDSEII